MLWKEKTGKTREAEIMEVEVKGAKQGQGIMEEAIKELRKEEESWRGARWTDLSRKEKYKVWIMEDTMV